jgi:hypothetical protein
MSELFITLKPKNVVNTDNEIVAKTHWPWYHKNFSGPKGWKKEYDNKLSQSGITYTKTIRRFFGHVIMINTGKSEFWYLPHYFTSKNQIWFGWLWWAFIIVRLRTYPLTHHIE